MDRVLRTEEDYTCYTSIGLVERVMVWLEREDGELETTVGTGICLAAVTYFVAHMVQALMRW